MITKRKAVRTLLCVCSMLVAFSYATKAQGTYWTHTGLTATGITAMTFDDAGNVFVGVAESGNPDGRVYRSTDNGASWDSLVTPPVSSIAVTRYGLIFLGTPSSGVYLSENYGNTWENVLPGLSIRSIALLTYRHIFVATNSGLYTSLNTGLTWTGSPAFNNTSVSAVDLAPSGLIIAGTSTAGMYRSSNQGNVWYYIGQFGFPIRTAILTSAYTILAGTELFDPAARIFRTSNLGTTWTFSSFEDRVCLGTDVAGGIYAGVGQGRVFKSEDEGVSWMDRTEGLGDAEVTVIKGGPNGYVFVGTRSHGLYRSITPVSSVEHSQHVPDEIALHQNYPNPFNPKTTINFQQARQKMNHGGSPTMSNWVTLRVFDVLGREITTLVNEVKEPGNHSVEWDASGQPSGVYLYRLTTGATTLTKKMLLVR